MNNNLNKKVKRQTRTRSKISGSKDMPRFSVFRSNRFMYAQLIDDVSGKSILGVSEKNIETKGTKSERAKALGLAIAKLAKDKKIKQVIFDRGHYAYHGRVKQIADGAREGGLKF